MGRLEGELKALQNRVSAAIRECMPTHQVRSQMILAMIGIRMSAKDVEERRNDYESFKCYQQRKKVLMGFVSYLYQQSRAKRIFRDEHKEPRKLAVS